MPPLHLGRSWVEECSQAARSAAFLMKIQNGEQSFTLNWLIYNKISVPGEELLQDFCNIDAYSLYWYIFWF